MTTAELLAAFIAADVATYAAAAPIIMLDCSWSYEGLYFHYAPQDVIDLMLKLNAERCICADLGHGAGEYYVRDEVRLFLPNRRFVILGGRGRPATTEAELKISRSGKARSNFVSPGLGSITRQDVVLGLVPGEWQTLLPRLPEPKPAGPAFTVLTGGKNNDNDGT